MRVLFFVQGEGNGHLTQAISMYQMLTRNGHQVVAAMAGTSAARGIPAFFAGSMDCPVYTYRSPGLHYSEKGRLREDITLLRLFKGLPRYLRSLKYIHSVVESLSPDLIINFYDMAGGLYPLLYKKQIPVVCIAHQYLFLHSRFRFPAAGLHRRLGLNLWSMLTACSAARILALSFGNTYPDDGRIQVVPPLLRQEIRSLAPADGDHILVYITQPRLSREVVNWHLSHPEVRLHCFLNSPGQPEHQAFDATLSFHAIHPQKFLNLLQSCKALVTTAGFESVCEAMYLGKPVMMIPVPNHFEQQCNAADGVRHGLGITHCSFNLSALLDYLPRHHAARQDAESWVDQAETLLISQLESLVPQQEHCSMQPA